VTVARLLHYGRQLPRLLGDTLEDVMAERTEQTVLHHLLETCRDGEHGFQFAKRHATDPDVKDLFTTLADERGRFAEQLVPHLQRLGAQAHTAGTTAGAIHRGWMTLMGSVSRHQDDVLMAEAERGERMASTAYQEALSGMLPPTVSELVETQHAAILEAHTRLVALDKARHARA
jgi:uncharacterized protein (TIGR02284 family)